VLAFILLAVAFGCKSKKKAMEATAVKSQMEQDAALKKQQEEEARRKEADEKERREAEERERSEVNERASTAPKAKLSEYFSAIANSGNVASANSSINEALAMFVSPETPVLIVISEYEGGKKDYDRPTVIRDYLNYLKDQKKNINVITDMKMDSAGKITELELKKPL